MGDQGQEDLVAELRRLQQQMAQMLQQQQLQEQSAIGNFHNPHAAYRNRSAIVPLAVERIDYEIKPQMILLVKQHLFHGLPAEIPMDHIENFEEICSTTRSNGVSPDFLKCKLFPFSLADKASRWLKSLPAGSITTWTECRAAFLDHFYTKTKTAALRNRIQGFQQLSGESFCEAWERFKEYRRECPHHGFSDESLLGIFYEGVHWDYRHALNAASDGDFMTKTRDGAHKLIENLAASSSNKSQEYDRTKRSIGAESNKIDELTAKIDQLLKGNQRAVHFVDENGAPLAEEESVQQDISYVNGQGFAQDQVYPQQGQQQQSQGQGFQKGFPQGFQCKQFVTQHGQNDRFQGHQQKQQFNNFQTPASSASNPQDELKMMMQQLMVNQQKTATEINTKFDGLYSDFNNLNSKYDAVCTHMKKLDTQIAQTAEAIKQPQRMLPGKPDANPPNLQDNKLEIMMQQMLDAQNINAQKVNQKMDSMYIELNGKFESLASCVDSLDQRSSRVASYSHPKESCQVVTVQGKVQDAQVSADNPEQSFPSEQSVIPEKRNIHASSLRKLPKLKDPGKFIAPCSILGLHFEDSLCDTGSSVNIMSMAIAKKLGIGDLKDSPCSISFGNASTTIPRGFICDLDVQVGSHLVPTDFHVVEMSKGAHMPLILGRPFLATVGANFDLPNKRVSFNNIDKDTFYSVISNQEAIQHPSCLTIDSQKNEVNEVLDGDFHSSIRISKKFKRRDKPKCENVTRDSYLTLIPQRCDGDSIEYKLKCKGRSKPFAKVKALLNPQLKEKGKKVMSEMIIKVIEVKMTDWSACPEVSSYLRA